MSRTGVNTVHAKESGEQLLSTATSPESYRAVIGQMELEMEAAKSAPNRVREQILSRISGKSPAAEGATPTGAGAAAAPAAALPDAARSALKEGVHTTFGNGQVWTLRNGQPERVK